MKISGKSSGLVNKILITQFIQVYFQERHTHNTHDLETMYKKWLFI